MIEDGWGKPAFRRGLVEKAPSWRGRVRTCVQSKGRPPRRAAPAFGDVDPRIPHQICSGSEERHARCEHVRVVATPKLEVSVAPPVWSRVADIGSRLDGLRCHGAGTAPNTATLSEACRRHCFRVVQGHWLKQATLDPGRRLPMAACANRR